MNIELLSNIFGYIATIGMLCGYMPQAIHTIRTRNTDGIAMPTFLSMGIGSFCFAIQGALTGNIPLLLTNVVTTLCSGTVTWIKIQNNRKARRNEP